MAVLSSVTVGDPLTFTKPSSRRLCSGSCVSKCTFNAAELKIAFRASNASILSIGLRIGELVGQRIQAVDQMLVHMVEDLNEENWKRVWLV